MKRNFFKITTHLVCLFSALSSQAANSGTPATVQSYTATCRYEHPLSTWDGCRNYTRAGAEARQCAEDEAILLCEQNYNTDCLFKGVKFKTIISHEFIGYKACEATVTVHGYRVR